MEVAPPPSVRALLKQVAARRRALDRGLEVYGERLSPDFGVFQFVDTSETGISRVLAWMLDPRGDHAQGDRFLRAFLEWLELDWTSGTTDRAIVQTEAPVALPSTTRFIDVLVSAPGYHLGIENKIGAPDQANQVADYLAFLGRDANREHCLVYLTPDGRAPSGGSISKGAACNARDTNCLREKSYEALIDLLGQCVALSRSQRVSYFLEDFSRHIAGSILGIENMSETAELATEILSDRDSLRAALEVFDTEREIKSRLMSMAEMDIREQCANRGWTIESDIGGERNDYLLALFSPDDTWGFGFAFDQSNYRALFYGLARRDDCDARRKPKTELLLKLNENRRGGNTIEWPWWLNPQPHDFHFPHSKAWAGTNDFWMSVADGQFAALVMRFLATMHLQLSKAKLLGLLA